MIIWHLVFNHVEMACWVLWVILHFMENDIETLHDVVMYKGVLLSECNDD